MEMNAGDQLISLLKVCSLINSDYFDFANRYLSAVHFFANESTLPTYFLNELNWRFDSYYASCKKEVAKGVAYNNAGNYHLSVDHFDSLTLEFPNSAWLRYEHYMSLADLKVAQGIGGEIPELWEEMRTEIFRLDPLYPAEIPVLTKDDAYELYLRLSIGELFKEEDKLLQDFSEYGQIAIDLHAYDFAAHIFWSIITWGKDERDEYRALDHFLYCLLMMDANGTVQLFNQSSIESAMKIGNERKSIKAANAFYKAY